MNTSANFSLSDLKHAQPIDGWQSFLHDGDGYLKTAVNAYAKGRKAFTSEILYNLIAMAIEKFVMAALMRHGALPYNHTIRDLAEAMAEAFPGAIDDISERLLRLDAFQQICDLDGFSVNPPGMEEIPEMLDLAQKMQILVSQQISS